MPTREEQQFKQTFYTIQTRTAIQHRFGIKNRIKLNEKKIRFVFNQRTIVISGAISLNWMICVEMHGNFRNENIVALNMIVVHHNMIITATNLRKGIVILGV